MPIELISSGFQFHISTTEPGSGVLIGPLYLELAPNEHQILAAQLRGFPRPKSCNFLAKMIFSYFYRHRYATVDMGRTAQMPLVQLLCSTKLFQASFGKAKEEWEARMPMAKENPVDQRLREKSIASLYG